MNDLIVVQATPDGLFRHDLMLECITVRLTKVVPFWHGDANVSVRMLPPTTVPSCVRFASGVVAVTAAHIRADGCGAVFSRLDSIAITLLSSFRLNRITHLGTRES